MFAACLPLGLIVLCPATCSGSETNLRPVYGAFAVSVFCSKHRVRLNPRLATRCAASQLRASVWAVPHVECYSVFSRRLTCRHALRLTTAWTSRRAGLVHVLWGRAVWVHVPDVPLSETQLPYRGSGAGAHVAVGCLWEDDCGATLPWHVLHRKLHIVAAMVTIPSRSECGRIAASTSG